MIVLKVNSQIRSFEGPPFKRLLDVLREDLSLTGTKEGCGEGECGACTVLVDGTPVNSCLIPVCQVDGQSIATIEGLGKPEALNPVQDSFLREGGAQCGICTPGMLMTAWAYVKNGGSADPDAIREQLAGNLCRCTGYQDIVDAVIATVRSRHATVSPRAKRRAKARAPVSPRAKRRVAKARGASVGQRRSLGATSRKSTSGKRGGAASRKSTSGKRKPRAGRATRRHR